MTILSAIRDRLSRSSPSAPDLAWNASTAAGDGDALPFAGYDRLDDRQVIEGLCDHSQIELEAVESYERSHKDRKPVLDKLRYMRGREPLPGYDALSVEEVVEEVTRTHSRRKAAEPASAAPTYQPTSARTRSSAPAPRPAGRT
jgi:hypothetical protein